MPSRMVLSDCRTMPWLQTRILFLELLINIKLIDSWKEGLFLKLTGLYRLKWRCRKMQACFSSGVMLLHFRDEQEVKYNIAGAQFHSGTCCCDDVCSVQALSGDENGRFKEVPTDILHHP